MWSDFVTHLLAMNKMLINKHGEGALKLATPR